MAGIFGLLISIILSVFTIALRLLFKIAAKTRLTLPLLSFLLIAAASFTPWVQEHQTVLLYAWLILTAGCLFSWLITLFRYIADRHALNRTVCRQIREAKESGQDLSRVRFDASGTLHCLSDSRQA